MYIKENVINNIKHCPIYPTFLVHLLIIPNYSSLIKILYPNRTCVQTRAHSTLYTFRKRKGGKTNDDLS